MPIPKREDERREAATRLQESTIERVVKAPKTVPTKEVPVTYIEIAFPGGGVLSETLYSEKGDTHGFGTFTDGSPSLLITRGTLTITVDLGKAYWYSISKTTTVVADEYTPKDE